MRKKTLIALAAIALELFTCSTALSEVKGEKEYYELGVFAYNARDYPVAERNLGKALERNPSNPGAHHYMGKTLIEMKQHRRAKEHLDKADKISPDLPELKYDIGLLYSKKSPVSDYEKSIRVFKEIIPDIDWNDPSYALAHYHIGMNNFRLKKYEKALEYLLPAADMRALVKANAWYYAAICHWRLKQYKKAYDKFHYVRKNADSEKLRSNADFWIRSIREPKLEQYSLYLKTGWQHDDNVRLDPLESDIYSNQADHVFVGYFSGARNLVNRKKIKIGAGYSHYQKMHQDLREYDLTGSIGNLYAKYRHKDLTFGFECIPSYYWVDSESYLRRFKFIPNIIWKASDFLHVRFSYGYYNLAYFQNTDRDGHSNDVFADINYSFLKKRGRLFGGLGYLDNSASEASESHSRTGAKLGVSYKLPWNMNIGLVGKYHDKKYKSPDKYYLVERHDTRYFSTMSLSRGLNDWLDVLAEFNYIRNNSNIKDYEYDRKVMGLSLAAKF